MSLNIGVDSYVSLEEANQYVEKNYVSTNSYRVKWNSLSDSDKEVLLRASTSALDQLKYIGSKRDYSQKLKFPRMTITSQSGMEHVWGQPNQFYDVGVWPNGSSGYDGGMLAIKQATCDNALVQASLETEVQSNIVNGIKGIKSKSVGPISETYDNTEKEARGARRGLYSPKIYAFLNAWLADSFLSI